MESQNDLKTRMIKLSKMSDPWEVFSYRLGLSSALVVIDDIPDFDLCYSKVYTSLQANLAPQIFSQLTVYKDNVVYNFEHFIQFISLGTHGINTMGGFLTRVSGLRLVSYSAIYSLNPKIAQTEDWISLRDFLLQPDLETLTDKMIEVCDSIKSARNVNEYDFKVRDAFQKLSVLFVEGRNMYFN